MTKQNILNIPQDELVALHNEFVDETTPLSDQLQSLKDGKSAEEIDKDPLINFLHGKIEGVNFAANSLHAFIVRHNSDKRGTLRADNAK